MPTVRLARPCLMAATPKADRSRSRRGPRDTVSHAKASSKRLIKHRQLLLGTFEIHRHNVYLGSEQTKRPLKKLCVFGVFHEFDQGQSGIPRYPRSRKVPHWHCRAR
jgi:hypothetical protein